MKQSLRWFGRQPWPSVALSVISAVLGIIAGPVVESLAPPLFQGQNLVYLVFFINSFLFLVVAIYSISFWSSTLKRVDGTYSKMSDLVKSLSVRFSFVPIGKGESKKLYREIADLIRLAEREVLYLNYGPVRRLESRSTFDRAVEQSVERRKYFDLLLRKIQSSEPHRFRFRRIIQVPRDRDIADLRDPLLLEHCKHLVEIGAKQPEFVSLKQSHPFVPATFAIIDRRYMIWVVDALDPDDNEYYTESLFIFDDPQGDMIHEFVRLFDRIDAHGSLVSGGELGLT